MIKIPEENVKLTGEQLQQIDEVQRRLANFQTELSIVVKNLIATKKENERITKEKEYQEELLAGLVIKVDSTQKKYTELLNQLEVAKKAVETNSKKAQEIGNSHVEKTRQLEEREMNLSVSEEKHKKNIEDFNIRSNQLLKDELAVRTAKDAFLKASESISWLR